MFEISRFPWVGRGILPNNGQGTYPATGVDAQRAEVRRTPPPPPASPAGIAALEQEITANQARQSAIKAELAGLEEAYQAAALLWDTAQLVSARTSMNAAADKMRSLRHEAADLVEELPALQKRLQAARLAMRAQHIEADAATLPAIIAEFEDLEREWRELAVELVERFGDLVVLRDGYRSTVRRVEDFCRETGTQPPATSLGTLRLPLFNESWLDGAPRSVQAAKVGLGIKD